jgi:hypothetical protein
MSFKNASTSVVPRSEGCNHPPCAAALNRRNCLTPTVNNTRWLIPPFHAGSPQRRVFRAIAWTKHLPSSADVCQQNNISLTADRNNGSLRGSRSGCYVAPQVRIIGSYTPLAHLLINGTAYRLLFGSDVINDGVYLELQDPRLPGHQVVLVAFRSDKNGQVSITAFEKEISLEVVVHFLEAVRAEWPTAGV